MTYRDRVYESALRKLWLAQRPNQDEARELRRRRLQDGSYPLTPDMALRARGRRDGGD